METVTDKFLRYISFETTSDENSTTHPSSLKELDLSRQLVKEMLAMGIADASLDENGYVMGTIPSNMDREVPVLGFIAHVDTSPDASGKDIKPQFIRDYDGTDIPLKGVPGLALRVKEFPEMLDYKGQTLITTDGTTLLGADDKAGVAEILTAAEYLLTHPEVKHGTIKIGFTPDEEIGCGVDFFDVQKFGADYAYTMDGGAIGELEYENFNAAGAKIHIQGCNIHPGSAKDKMVNAILVGMELARLLPPAERPEHTVGYEGFFHLTGFQGTVEEATMSYIIRDHDRARFEKRKLQMEAAVAYINNMYGDIVTLDLRDQYYNMREQVEPHYHIIEKAIRAMEMAGIKPKIQPIRGGTDGARLSYMGLPCPNLFAGGHNFHGKLEFVPVESMEKAVEVIKNLIFLYAA
ncbi:MAG: peptidase T [Bacteroidales bacterium]|nr:peptidase T [Bacteroidales bacterium]